MIYTVIFRQRKIPLIEYKKKHFNTEKEALEYAKELAREHPGSEFGVYKALLTVCHHVEHDPTINKFVSQVVPEEEKLP